MTLVYGSNPIYLNNIWDDLLTDFLSGISNPLKSYRISEVSFPKYPPTSFGLLKNGTGVLTCAVSGFTHKEINVEIEDRSLIITGKPINEDVDEKNEINYLRMAFSKKEFKSDVRFTDAVDKDAIEVTLKDGLLTILLPLKESEKIIKKQLEIK